MNIGMFSITNAEPWGLYQGLLLAWNRGIQLLTVEVDRLCVTQVIHSQTLSTNALSSLVNGILKLLSRNWQVSMHHIYREANFAVDFLANFALSIPLRLHVLPGPPHGVDVYLRGDSFGTTFLTLLSFSFC